MKKLIAIIGARPQFIKHAPIELELKKSFTLKTIHTGQHYDKEMSEVFFTELGITVPDFLLKTNVKHHGEQTAAMMIEIEKILMNEKPDAVLVYGDTNSTLAGALVASKMHIKLIHIEAGLRSFNKSMPEEINRILTDHVSDFLFTPTKDGVLNLQREGICNNVFLTGDVMIDLLKRIVATLDSNKIEVYYYATLHRPYNVDNIDRLLNILHAINKLDKVTYFPVHPRTMNNLKGNQINLGQFENVRFMSPASYKQNITFLNNSEGLITDSGGMQKEAYFLKKKCITVRSETEWVETLNEGWNHLVFDDLSCFQQIFDKKPGAHNANLYGDGSSSAFIRKILLDTL